MCVCVCVSTSSLQGQGEELFPLETGREACRDSSEKKNIYVNMLKIQFETLEMLSISSKQIILSETKN